MLLLAARRDTKTGVTKLPVGTLKRIIGRLAAQAYASLFYSPHWIVGYRAVGDDLWDTQTLSGTHWRKLDNPKSRFLADPIPFHHDGRTFLFVEDFDHRTQKGVISVVEFDARGPVGPVACVLEEDWHLSYPLVFAAEGAIWMMPECSANREIALYRAVEFPRKWIKEATIIPDIVAVDATIFQHESRYWLLTSVHNGQDDFTDLHVYSSPELLGPWRPHKLNPVLRDPRSARSAGPVVRRNGKLWRPVQDCSERYGGAVGLAEITRLDDDACEQSVRSVLKPCREWPGRRLHTLSQAGGFEFIDGSANVLRRSWM
jgi:hypothetical protein